MLHHHIFASESSSPHISPVVASSQSPQHASLGDKEKDKLPARHTSAHSSLVSAHTVEISDGIAWSCICTGESY